MGIFNFLEFQPMDVPEDALTPTEKSIINGIRTIEITMLKLTTFLMALFLAGGILCGFLGYYIVEKLDTLTVSTDRLNTLERDVLILKHTHKLQALEKLRGTKTTN